MISDDEIINQYREMAGWFARTEPRLEDEYTERWARELGPLHDPDRPQERGF